MVGGDDVQWGQVPVVVLAGGDPADFSEVAASVVAVLGRAARPARLVRVEVIPLLASGKPDRRALASNMGAWHKELGRSGPNNND